MAAPGVHYRDLKPWPVDLFHEGCIHGRVANVAFIALTTHRIAGDGDSRADTITAMVCY